ncbi:histone-lysine N-methyltransferase SETMAR [Trichonephila clavipes]|nr:histone-lysine N-methyltransferase SETMAR [Trichonephila clavipes]
MDVIHQLLGVIVGITHTIVHQYLNFWKICAQWVPRHLTVEQRNTRRALSLSHVQRYHEEDYGFLFQIVTGDETWGYHFEPESKHCKCATSPPPKKSKAVRTSSGKDVMSFFLDHNDPLLVKFLEEEPPSMTSVFKPLYRTFRSAIKSKSTGMLSNGVILLHENARPHTFNELKTALQQWRRESRNIYCTFHTFTV